MKISITDFGFIYGPATVERYCGDEKKGWVVMGVKTAKYPHGVQIYVTKTGKVRVHADGKEWKP